MKIEKLDGIEERLYQLVAPLVMRPSVIRQNNNYPFKTSNRHVWFVALDEEQVIGFIPVEIRNQYVVINNYYVMDDDVSVLTPLLQEVISSFSQEYKVRSVTHTHHLAVFQENGFDVIKIWKLYVKMEYLKK